MAIKKEILVVSHFDTDGVTSAAIFGKLLKKLDKRFSFNIIKGLEPEFIQALPKNKVIIFLDVGSGLIKEISKLSNQVFVIDHHELDVNFQFPENINMINPYCCKNILTFSALCGKNLKRIHDPSRGGIGIKLNNPSKIFR